MKPLGECRYLGFRFNTIHHTDSRKQCTRYEYSLGFRCGLRMTCPCTEITPSYEMDAYVSATFMLSCIKRIFVLCLWRWVGRQPEVVDSMRPMPISSK